MEPSMLRSSSLVNVPNMLTLARIALIPLFVVFYIVTDDMVWMAGVLFAVAAGTDWLDGYIARKMGMTSKFGEFLDPVADKLLVVVALVVLIGQHGSLWLTLPGVIIVSRELFISALREWMAEINRRGVVSVTNIAKIKTTVQMIALTILLCNPPVLERPWVIIGLVMIYIAAGMTLWSMVIYLRATWQSIKENLVNDG